MSGQETVGQNWKPPHSAGILTGALMGLPWWLTLGFVITTSPIEGLKIALAGAIPFSVFGLVFDFVWMIIPAKRFYRKCMVYWALVLPASRVLFDVLLALLNDANMGQYLTETYGGPVNVVLFLIIMVIPGVTCGMVFSFLYEKVYRFLYHRSHPST